MMEYTVQPGDSLYKIAQRFGTTIEDIIQANGLTSNIIYVGQILWIPTAQQPLIYTVQPGDSLYEIARRFNTTIESIMVLNNLSSISLTIGQELQIPQYSEVVITVDLANLRSGPGTNYNVVTQMVRGAKLPVINSSQNWYQVRIFNGNTAWIFGDLVEFNVYDGSLPIIRNLGFYTLEEGPALPSSYESFVNNTDVISEVGLFMFRISQANPTEIERFGEFTDQEIRNLVNIAHRNNIKIMPVVHNLLYEGGVEVAKQIVQELVSSRENRVAFSENLVELIETYNFDGVNIDIEDVYQEDSELLSALFTQIGNVMDREGYYFSASIPSRISDEPFNPFSDPFQYSPIGRAVDEFVVMLYNEFGWPGSPPGPAVTIGWMERVLNYTITRVPREKVLAAVSVFGFNFNLTTGRNTYVTYQMAIDLAQRYGAEIQFNEERQTPMFSYTDDAGNQHEVWFEDARSLKAKVDLADELGIAGIALWRLGMEDPAMWDMLRTEAVVRKV